MLADIFPGLAEGIRTDRDGNLWSSVGWAGSGTDGANCLTPDGELIGRIVLSEPCANLCFGDVAGQFMVVLLTTDEWLVRFVPQATLRGQATFTRSDLQTPQSRLPLAWFRSASSPIGRSTWSLILGKS